MELLQNLSSYRRGEYLAAQSGLRSEIKAQTMGWHRLYEFSEADFRPRGTTMRPQKGQPFAVLVEVDQGDGRQQPCAILLRFAVVHLGAAEDVLQYAK